MGWVGAVGRAGRLVATCLPMATKKDALAACSAALAPGFAPDFRRSDPLLTALAGDLGRYFAGEPVALGRYPVDLSDHPPFRSRALLAAQRIPYGEVRTYGWVAARAGRSGGARAAGQAMSRNPIPLVIPCHRVVTAGGGLGGFGGGLDLKRTLLRLEGIACDDRGLLAR